MLLPNVYNLGYSTGQLIRRIVEKHQLPDLPPLAEIWTLLAGFPGAYKTWWLNLVASDPVHVFVETTLIVSTLYMFLSKNKVYRDNETEKLTHAEQQELLREWRDHGRGDLAPIHVAEIDRNIVVHEMHGRTMELEVGAQKRTVLNFATLDFLGMADNQLVKDASRQALAKYGCGSCGPRGFYGTIDVHLKLENAISSFTNTDGAIMYSDGASTVSSTIAAFAKRGDLLVVDDGVYEPIITGVTLCRANVKWFRHNDMDDLRRVLKEVARTDKKIGRRPSDQRRFIVVEGLYKNSGTVVPFDEVVALKHEFSYRLILDESCSFGTVGPHGRGVVEKYGMKHMYDAEIVTISLENALGSVGGVTVGNEEVVDHQRLSGAGYCFSASSPPFTASAAISALDQLKNHPELLARFNHNRQYFYDKLKSASMKDVFPDRLKVTSDECSPLVYLELARSDAETGGFECERTLTEIEYACMRNDVAVVTTGYRSQGVKRAPLPPALRLTVSASHTEADIDKALSVLRRAALDAVL